MGIAERRVRERVELRQRILDAARELFMREGYERVTMRRIAEAIEYSPTAIYLHFEDKDDLVRALCSFEFSRLLEALPQQPPADPIEGLRQLGLAYARFGLAHPNHYRFMFMTPKNPDYVPEPTDPGHQSFDVLRRAVQSAIDAGALRPGNADTIAQVFWSTTHGAIALLISLRPDCWPTPPASDLLEQVLEANLRAFRKDA